MRDRLEQVVEELRTTSYLGRIDHDEVEAHEDHLMSELEALVLDPFVSDYIHNPKGHGLPLHRTTQDVIDRALSYNAGVLVATVVGKWPWDTDRRCFELRIGDRTLLTPGPAALEAERVAVAMVGCTLSSGRVVRRTYPPPAPGFGEVLAPTDSPEGTDLTEVFGAHRGTPLALSATLYTWWSDEIVISAAEAEAAVARLTDGDAVGAPRPDVLRTWADTLAEPSWYASSSTFPQYVVTLLPHDTQALAAVKERATQLGLTTWDPVSRLVSVPLLRLIGG